MINIKTSWLRFDAYIIQLTCNCDGLFLLGALLSSLTIVFCFVKKKLENTPIFGKKILKNRVTNQEKKFLRLTLATGVISESKSPTDDFAVELLGGADDELATSVPMV